MISIEAVAMVYWTEAFAVVLVSKCLFRDLT